LSHTAVIIEEGQLNSDGSIDHILSLANSLGHETSVALFSSDNAKLSDKLTRLDCSQIYVIKNDTSYGSPLSDEVIISSLEWFCKEKSVDLVLMNKTSWSLNIAPRVAFRIKASYAHDCIDIKRQGAEISCIRPVYGGNALAHISLAKNTSKVATIRVRSVQTPQKRSDTPIPITELEPEIKDEDLRVKIIKTVTQIPEGPDLGKAEIVIAGGRGLGGPEPFEKLKELAKILDGAVGASRAACDAGWIDHNFQIGLTGKTVTPNMYLSFGISGASQHMAGCSGSRNIVSINSDKNANIFKDSKYGVIGDWNLVLPAFIAAVRELVDEN
jgi:electron transfer flavoprotein alpha subunit